MLFVLISFICCSQSLPCSDESDLGKEVPYPKGGLALGWRSTSFSFLVFPSSLMHCSPLPRFFPHKSWNRKFSPPPGVLQRTNLRALLLTISRLASLTQRLLTVTFFSLAYCLPNRSRSQPHTHICFSLIGQKICSFAVYLFL